MGCCIGGWLGFFAFHTDCLHIDVGKVGERFPTVKKMFTSRKLVKTQKKELQKKLHNLEKHVRMS